MIQNSTKYTLAQILRASEMLKKYASLPKKQVDFRFIQNYRVNSEVSEWEAQYRLTIKHGGKETREGFSGGNIGLRSYYHKDSAGQEFGGFDGIGGVK